MYALCRTMKDKGRVCKGAHCLAFIVHMSEMSHNVKKTYILTYAPNEDSTQPAHLMRSVIRIYVVHIKKLASLAIQINALTALMGRLSLTVGRENGPERGRICFI